MEIKRTTERVVTLSLNNEEEELLKRLANTFSHDDIQYSPEKALEAALMLGSKWDTYLVEKMASALWQLGGCTYEESEEITNSYKKKLDEEWKIHRATKEAQQELAVEELEPEL